MIAFAPAAIRFATDADASALLRVAELDSQRPLTGAAIVAYDGDRAVAAMSLVDGRVVADPFRPTLNAVAALRVRAGAVRAAERTPSLAVRMRSAVRVPTPAAPAAA